MPINLLIDKPETIGKEKPTNLLPEIVGVNKDAPKEPFVIDIKNAFMAGLNRTWASAARVPATVYDLGAIPQNFLVKAIGREDLQVQSPEWLMENPVAELYDYQTQAYRNEIAPTKTFEEALKTKDFDGVGRHLAIQVAENAPQQIGIILSYMAGYPAAGLAGMGLMASSDALKEGRKNKKDPAMNAYNALTHGVVEAGFEQIGTMGILKKWSGVLAKSFGKKNATKIMGDVFKTIFYSMLGEGNEEFWTSLAQDFSSFTTGVNPDAMKGSLPRAFEAGTVGAISGGILVGPSAIKLGQRSASLEKMQREVNTVTKTLQEEAKTPEMAKKGIVEPLSAKEAIAKGKEGGGISQKEGLKLVDESRKEFGDKILTQLRKSGGAEYKDNNLTYMITRSAKEKGKWQLTTIRNTDGLPMGDTLYNSHTEAINGLADMTNTLRKDLPPEIGLGINKGDYNFKYKLRQRDIGMGTQPKEGYVGNEGKRVVIYDRPLSSEEIKNYELEPEGYSKLPPKEAKPTKAPVKVPIPGEEKQLLEDIKELEERKLYGKVPWIIKKETTILREKIANIERGIRAGRVTTQKEIKETQTAIIRLLESTELAAVDRAKFITTIKNIQTPEQLQEALPEIKDRMIRLETAAEKRDISTKIKKELKTTKPLKVGQRRVGKFDYQTNKMFDTIRDYNKLNQTEAQAEFDKFPEEVSSEVDLIKKRFLSLKANGASASAEIHRQVLADIMRIKRLGKEAKDEADLEKKLNRQERVDNALSSIDKITGDKKSIMGKITNAYRKGFSNIYSMLNSIAGKDFAEEYDPELSENKRNTAIYRKTLEITRESSRIYNEKNVMRMFETMSTLDYEITDTKDNLTTEISKLEIIDIYNSIKNDKKKQDYYEAFGENQVQSLIAKLTANDVLFADMLQETVQGYREILNKRNIETTGRDLGVIENYWPATSEFQVSVIDDMRVQGETPSALKERAKTRVIPVPKNAWYKAQRHVAQAEHVDKISREYEAMKRMFTDRKVKHAMKEKYGEDVYNTLMAQIENISLNKQTERIDAISSVFQKAINNWVTAKIALNPSTFVRQLMSVGNYAEQMNVAEWTAGFFKGILTPKQTFDFVWKNAPFLEARFNKGYSEALKEAIESAERASVNKNNWTKFLTSLVRGGDITAIIYGGYPLIQSELAKGESMQEAINTFEQATLKAQQSGLSSSISQFQNSRNPFARLFLAFKNTSNQYFRKMADAIISYQNGDISLEQFTKTMTIYAVIQPILYVAAGHATKAAFGLLGSLAGLGGGEDPEEMLEKFLNDVMIQLIVSPVNAIPIIDDAVRAAANKLVGKKIYQVFSTPLFDDLESGFRALTKKEVTGEDYFKTATSILEPATALPIKTGIRYYENLTGKKKKSTKKLVR